MTDGAGRFSCQLQLDHLTVVAPSLAEGVAHVRACLDIEVPFGQRHNGMGTHNHLLQLGDMTYLEIVALDPEAEPPPGRRWFGLDDQVQVRHDWDAGLRLRGWVARTDDMDAVIGGREAVFGRKVALPASAPSFDFAIPEDGSLPWGGAVPSIIDRRGKPRSMATMADRGARLRALSLAHPDADRVLSFLNGFTVDRLPTITPGPDLRYCALIDTPAGPRVLY